MSDNGGSMKKVYCRYSPLIPLSHMVVFVFSDQVSVTVTEDKSIKSLACFYIG